MIVLVGESSGEDVLNTSSPRVFVYCPISLIVKLID